jgi:Fe2+ or Zn2+ uptake regulation protein
MDAPPDVASDASRLRARGLRVTGPRLAILAMLRKVGGHRSADELVAALREGGYHHARTTVYNALDDLARAGLVRAAPVDSGALRYESLGEEHHHFVCRSCGRILNVPIEPDLADRDAPAVEGATVDEVDVIYRGFCAICQAKGGLPGSDAPGQAHSHITVSPPPTGPTAGDESGHESGDDEVLGEDGELAEQEGRAPAYERMRALG